MDIVELDETVDELIAMSLPDEDIKIENHSTFDEDGIDADSLAIVETMFSVNERFGIEIEEESISDIKTVGHLKLYIISESGDFDLNDANQIDLDKSKLQDIEI